VNSDFPVDISFFFSVLGIELGLTLARQALYYLTTPLASQLIFLKLKMNNLLIQMILFISKDSNHKFKLYFLLFIK
jgi:hypothetical protein